MQSKIVYLNHTKQPFIIGSLHKLLIMKKILTLLFYIVCFTPSFAQDKSDILRLQPDSAITGTRVLKIAGDKNSSSFIIWITEAVKAHKHLHHSETIYVLEGEGEMLLGINKHSLKPGDFIFIPEGMVHSVNVKSAVPLKVLSVQSPEFLGDDRVFID